MNTRKRLFAQGTRVEIAKSRSEIERLLTKHGATSNAKEDFENRRRWRCLLLVLKAKLEAVANKLVSFEEEFLSHIIIPNGSGETIGQWVGPQLAAAYDRGARMPPLLGDGR